MKAHYKRYVLKFRCPGVTSRGVLREKETWFLFLTDELLNNGKINRSETINVKDIYKIISDYFKIALKN